MFERATTAGSDLQGNKLFNNQQFYCKWLNLANPLLGNVGDVSSTRATRCAFLDDSGLGCPEAMW